MKQHLVPPSLSTFTAFSPRTTSHRIAIAAFVASISCGGGNPSDPPLVSDGSAGDVGSDGSSSTTTTSTANGSDESESSTPTTSSATSLTSATEPETGTDDTTGAPTETCPPTASVGPGETNRSVTVGGTNRTYLLHVPPGYTGETPIPVVIDFHPLGGTGMQQRGLSGWGNLADSETFMVVWPDGIGNSWNVGRCCPPAFEQGVDDVAFVRAILAQLETDACIDSKRIYATGCSNGGGMSYKVACEAADVIAAVAPVDFDCVVGPENVPSCGGCNPARPISEIQFRATGDFAVNYNGGPAPIPQGMDFPGARRNFEDWGAINMCTGNPQTVAERPACETYPTCADGVQTTLCTQQGGSHCGNYNSLDIVSTAWEAFRQISLP